MASLLGKRISAPTRTTSASGTKVRFTWSITACRAIAGAGTAPASGRYTTASLTGAPPWSRTVPPRAAPAGRQVVVEGGSGVRLHLRRLLEDGFHYAGGQGDPPGGRHRDDLFDDAPVERPGFWAGPDVAPGKGRQRRAGPVQLAEDDLARSRRLPDQPRRRNVGEDESRPRQHAARPNGRRD